VDELIHEVEAMAHKNPTLFLAGSLAVGLGIGRFARASSKARSDDSNYRGADSNRDNRDRGGLYGAEDYQRDISDGGYPANEAFPAGDDYLKNDYSKRAGHYASGRVTEEDYLADDFASAEGDSTGLENGDYRSRDVLVGGDALAEKNALTGGSETNSEITSRQKSQCIPGKGNQPKGNQPFGGDFYE
jgi:hypothetical protein